MSERDDPALELALAAESRLGARCAAMAAKAELEGRPSLARLLKALAASQEARVRRYLMLLRGKIAATPENLAGLAERELPELLAGYPRMIQALASRGEKPAANALEQAARVNRGGLEMLAQALERGAPEEAIHVCQVCGHLAAGERPERCPVCGAVAGRFQRVE